MTGLAAWLDGGPRSGSGWVITALPRTCSSHHRALLNMAALAAFDPAAMEIHEARRVAFEKPQVPTASRTRESRIQDPR